RRLPCGSVSIRLRGHESPLARRVAFGQWVARLRSDGRRDRGGHGRLQGGRRDVPDKISKKMTMTESVRAGEVRMTFAARRGCSWPCSRARPGEDHRPGTPRLAGL